MKQWVLSVAGISILSVLADVILPVGQTRKYVKTVINVVVTAVLAQPVLFFATNLDFSYSELAVQEEYLQYVSTAHDIPSEQLQNCLEQCGFESPSVYYDRTLQVFVVSFSEKRTVQLVEKANSALKNYFGLVEVKFLWNKSDTT